MFVFICMFVTNAQNEISWDIDSFNIWYNYKKNYDFICIYNVSIGRASLTQLFKIKLD